MSDLRVALTTSLNDRLVAPLRRTLDEVEKNLKAVEKELEQVAQASNKAGTAMGAMQGPAQAAKQVTELARNTQNAVSLAQKLQSAWSLAGNTIKGVTAGVAAFQAAKFVVAAPLQQARSYDRQLADAANTAFSGRDQSGRRMGMGELDATVTTSLRTGGGKREDVLAALNEMLASGVVTPGQAQNLLPTVSKYATAGNASATELSNIVVRALQSGFKEADIPKVLDMALAAGQKGGFELKDMAKWLPKLLAAGQMSGLGGMEGYARILASAQGSLTTAGSKDEAGNNLLNLLLKINASDTAMDAKKLGIDLSGSLSAARGKGVNSLDAFVNLVDQVAGRDKGMLALREKAANAGTDEERKTTYSAQADILQGSAIGKIVQDRQALLSLVAELNKRDYITGVKRDVMGANGQYGASNFDLISSTADFKINQADNEKLIAQTGALGGVNEALGKLASGSTELYQRYPAFVQAVEAAKLAITGLAAAAGAAGLASLAMGGAGGVGGKVIGTVAGALTGGAMATAGGLAMGAAGLAAAGAAGYYGASALGAGKLLEGNAGGDFVGEKVARLLAFLGNDEAKAAVGQNDKMDAMTAQAQALTAVAQRPIKVVLDGREIAAAVNGYNDFVTRRK